MEIRKQVTVNLRYRGATPVVDAVQGDSARVVDLVLMAGDTPWKIPQGAAILVQYCCPDGTGGTYDTLPDGRSAYALTDEGMTLYLAPQVCSVAGDVRMQLTILDGEAQVSTFEMKIAVEPKVTAVTETGDYTNLEQWWSQQGGGGLPQGGTAGQVLRLDKFGYAGWETPSKEMVSLDQVNNTSDRDKPVSIPQREAINLAEANAKAYAEEEVMKISTDYILAQGVSGDWNYRKWNSGVYECWRNVEGADSCTHAWGSVYSTNRGNYWGASGYPITFADAPVVCVTPYFVNNAYWVAPVNAGTNSRGQGFCMVSPVSVASLSFKLSIHAIGRWK